MEITTNFKNSVPVTVMRDGDVAIITNWSDRSYIGRMVHRVRDSLNTVGQGYGNSWPIDIPWDDGLTTGEMGQLVWKDCLVRILSEGDEVTLKF